MLSAGLLSALSAKTRSGRVQGRPLVRRVADRLAGFETAQATATRSPGDAPRRDPGPLFIGFVASTGLTIDAAPPQR